MKERFQSFSRAAKVFPRVLKLVWKASPSYTLLTILLTVISSAVAPAQIWISKVTIDRVTESVRLFAQGIPVDWYAVLLPVGLIFLIWIVGGVCQSLTGGIREVWGFQVWIYGEHSILKKATQLDLAFYETPAFYDQMENARRDGYRIYNLAMLWRLFIFHSLLGRFLG